MATMEPFPGKTPSSQGMSGIEVGGDESRSSLIDIHGPLNLGVGHIEIHAGNVCQRILGSFSLLSGTEEYQPLLTVPSVCVSRGPAPPPAWIASPSISLRRNV